VIREQLLSGMYRPSPVRRVVIPKPDGGIAAACATAQPRLSRSNAAFKRWALSAPLNRDYVIVYFRCRGRKRVTFFTFLPSFLFIFLGGPFIESTHRNLAFTAPLTAITAAVVGVIVTLAVFFAWHVLWPRGMTGPFDAISAAIGIAATIALFRFKVGVIPVVAAVALAGLAVRFAS
jgi:hypothetical protein